MRFIVGLMFFWLITFSIKMFLEKKGNVDEKFSLVLTFTTIGIVEFIFGILNVLKLGTILFIVMSLCYLVYL